jgi:RimJ/RimL family protein N-acetyltransferase
MIRYASSDDFQFIFTLIRIEAKNGHFVLEPASVEPFGRELKSVLASRTRLDGTHAYALIYEESDQPLGFVIVSFNSLNNIYELLLSAIWPRHRDKGKGKAMIAELLSPFKIDLMARCTPESEAMFHILTTNGFRYVGTGQKGVRALVRAL